MRKSKATPKRRAGFPPAGLCYIESSALLAALLENDIAAKTAIRSATTRITSALTFAESARAIVRARVSGRLNQEQEREAVLGLKIFARRCDIVSVTEAVLARAGDRFPVEPVRTLDAVHLATVEVLPNRAPITIVTRDIRVRENAIALGYFVA